MPGPNRIGLTRRRIALIAKHVRRGVPPADAAKVCRVSSSRYYDYMARGRKAYARVDDDAAAVVSANDRLCMELVDAVEAADADYIARLSEVVLRKATERGRNGYLCLRLLAARRPREFGQRTQIEIAHDDNGPVRTTPELVEAMAASFFGRMPDDLSPSEEGDG